MHLTPQPSTQSVYKMEVSKQYRHLFCLTIANIFLLCSSRFLFFFFNAGLSPLSQRPNPGMGPIRSLKNTELTEAEQEKN